jgi:hypothetical protein
MLIGLATFLLGNANATTYKTTSHGKFTDERIWQPSYPGSTVKAGDSIIISSQVVLNVPVAVEGFFLIEKGAALQGNKELAIAKGGYLTNKGNTVVKRLSNDGQINNELVLEAMLEVENTGIMNNTSATFAGSTLLNRGGILDGNKGSYFSNNSVIASPNSIYGKDIKVFQASFTNPVAQIDEVIYCDASLNVYAGSSDKMLVEVTGNALKNLQSIVLEKSIDGKYFYKVAQQKAESNTLLLEDRIAMENIMWYRLSGYDANGKQYAFPEAMVKISDKNETLSMLNRIEY